jgi:hypothetical protein
VIRGVKTAQEDAESDEELQGFPEERTEDHRQRSLWKQGTEPVPVALGAVRPGYR